MPTETWSGGCQCGAVRYQLLETPSNPCICHCRMCQKAFGSFYAPLVNVHEAKLTWTRGEPARFQSSSAATRGFCAQCGTPLTYEAPDGVALAIGAFDEPADITPKLQWGLEAKLPYVDSVPALPGHDTLTDENAAPFLKTLVSYQHPDHDTEAWPRR